MKSLYCGLISGATEGARQLVIGMPSRERRGIATGLGVFAGFYDLEGVAAVVGSAGLVQTVQNIASDLAEAADVPASSAPASSGGK